MVPNKLIKKKTGTATIIKEQKISLRLPDNTGIYTAEAYIY